MDPAEIEHITRNLPELLNHIHCSSIVLAYLKRDRILSQADVEAINETVRNILLLFAHKMHSCVY